MRTNIHANGTTLTPALREYVEGKIVASLRPLVGSDESAMLDIELELTTKHHKKGDVWRTEANLSMGGQMIRVEKTAEDIHTAIDLVEEEIVRETKKFKDRTRTNSREGGRKFKDFLRRWTS